MRVLVTGTSGAGKTTMAKRLEKALALPRIELDAINWQAGWYGLNDKEPAEFARRVEAAIAAPAWIVDGNYGGVRAKIWERATHLLWLDYPRWRIMGRVIRRSMLRAIDRRELWPGTGNRESVTRWLDHDHPIRWAWSTAARRRRDYERYVADPAHAHLKVFRIRRSRDAEDAVAVLARDCAREKADSARHER